MINNVVFNKVQIRLIKAFVNKFFEEQFPEETDFGMMGNRGEFLTQMLGVFDGKDVCLVDVGEKVHVLTENLIEKSEKESGFDDHEIRIFFEKIEQFNLDLGKEVIRIANIDLGEGSEGSKGGSGELAEVVRPNFDGSRKK